MGVPEFWGVITSLSTLAALAGWVHQWQMYWNLDEEAGVFLTELITHLNADGEDKVLVPEPESVIAATVRFWDRFVYSAAFQAGMFYIPPSGRITGGLVLQVAY